jgi:hypothetical protein
MPTPTPSPRARCSLCAAPAGPGFQPARLTPDAERRFRLEFPGVPTTTEGLCQACLRLSRPELRRRARRLLRALLPGVDLGRV